MDHSKRQKNEKQFSSWKETMNGGRLYWFEIPGRSGWKARYVKEVNEKEETLTFRQEIYDENDVLRELHEKYPVDKGHQKLIENGN